MADIEKIGEASSSGYDEHYGSSSTPLNHGVDKTSQGEKSVEYIGDADSREDLLGDVTNYEVKRSLKARHISMIALGGTIGTGLFISSGSTLSAGPVLALISYLFITSLAFFVTQSLGEMATLIPVSGSFTQFITRWCSPALGAANGWNYWFSWAITFALELSVIGDVISRWGHGVPNAGWISIFFVVLTAANMFPVKFYGEFEFWIASIKVVAVAGWLLYAFIMVCGAGKTGPVGFRYWRHPGPWGDGAGLVSNHNTDRLLAWVETLISAAFTFQGVELTGLSCGEAKNPRKTVPSAIRKVIYRIIIFYVLSMFFMGLLIPFNDPKLASNSGNYTDASPFIIAMENSGTKVLPDIFNAVILLAIISAGNSNIYCGSRVLYALGQSKVAPPIFTWTTKHGVPYVAVLFTAAFGALGYLSVSSGGNTAFNWLLNITAVSGLIAWVNITFVHIRFMNILRARNISRDTLPFKAQFMPFGAYYATALGGILCFVQGFEAFFSINASKFFTAYISLIFFAVCWVIGHFYFNGFKNAFTWRSLLIPIDECDIDTGVRDVDDEEWEDDAPKNLWDKFWDIAS